MRVLAMVGRIVSLAISIVVLALSFVPNFVQVTADTSSMQSFSAAQSAWHEIGVVGGMLLVVAFAASLSALILGAAEHISARFLDFSAAAAYVLALGALVVYVATVGPDDVYGLTFSTGPGWAGIVTFVFAAFAVLLSISVGVLSSQRQFAATPAPTPLMHGAVVDSDQALSSNDYVTTISAPSDNSKALWSMILGIVSFACLAPFTSVAAIVLSRQASKEIAASGGEQGGAGQAKAGFILGVISLVLSVLAVLFYAAVVLVVLGS